MTYCANLSITTPPRPSASCLDCAVRHLCLPRTMHDSDCTLVDRLVVQRYRLLRGEHLYRTNDPVRKRLYAIQSGQFKTYHLSQQGEQRITGFQFAGDFLGLESIGLSFHRNNTVALSDVALCEFSHTQLVDAALGSKALAAQLCELLSKQLAQEQRTTLLLAHRAEQKISGFLLALPSERCSDGRHARVLELNMTRADIGAFLGLADTTVSRTLNRLQRHGYLMLDHRQLTILDAGALHAIAAGTAPDPVGCGIASGAAR